MGVQIFPAKIAQIGQHLFTGGMPRVEAVVDPAIGDGDRDVPVPLSGELELFQDAVLAFSLQNFICDYGDQVDGFRRDFHFMERKIILPAIDLKRYIVLHILPV